MEKIRLRHSGVRYDELKHTYTLKGKPLSGITGMLSRQLFPNKYDDIPEYIMERARVKGKRIHSEIEMYNNGFEPADPSPEFVAFSLLGLDILEAEYIVTDGEHFATPIDLIGTDFMAYDIKTTYKVDEDYCSWQLSIGDYLFAKQTNKSAKGLAVIWLRDGKAEIVPVRRIPDSEIERLLQAEINGERFTPLPVEIGISQTTLKSLRNAESEIIAIKTNLEAAEKKCEELKAGLLKLMLDANVTKYTGFGITLTVKKAYERTSLDSKALKAQLPEIYDRYGKTTTVKESLTIKLDK
jgi:hypothetical protein